jgi:hypothetical protein
MCPAKDVDVLVVITATADCRPLLSASATRIYSDSGRRCGVVTPLAIQALTRGHGLTTA